MARRERATTTGGTPLNAYSSKGIYAAGDLVTRMQAAVAAAADGMQVGAMLNLDLAMEFATGERGGLAGAPSESG